MKSDDPRRKNLKRGGSTGRPKGCLNKVTRDVQLLAKQFVDDASYRTSLKGRLAKGQAPHMETLLWHYAYGKPKESLDVKFPQGVPPLSVIIHPSSLPKRT